MSLIDYLFGRRLATYEEGEQRVGVIAGIPHAEIYTLHIAGDEQTMVALEEGWGVLVRAGRGRPICPRPS